MLNIVAHRKDTELMLTLLLEFGVSGASISTWRLAEANCKLTDGGQRINREFGSMSLLLPIEKVAKIKAFLEEIIQKYEMKEACFFTHSVPIAKTFTTIK